MRRCSKFSLILSIFICSRTLDSLCSFRFYFPATLSPSSFQRNMATSVSGASSVFAMIPSRFGCKHSCLKGASKAAIIYQKSNLLERKLGKVACLALSFHLKESFFGHYQSTTTLHKKRDISLCATLEEIKAIRETVEGDAKERMEKALEAVQSSYNGLRTGRANPLLLDRVQVEYYGGPVKLKSIAQITVSDSSTLLIQPYDKSSLKDIEKAILKSNLGLTPIDDGNVIRVSLPQLTADRRKELLKVARNVAEEGKIAVRNIRKDSLKAYQKLEKEKKLSEDNVRDLSNDFQKLTDAYVKKVDELYKQKEKEMTTI